MNKVLIAYITYNRLKYTQETLPALLKTDYSSFRVVCVDNASTDGTGEYLNELAEDDKRIEVIALDKNLGCAGGLNKALALRKKEEYFVRTSNDFLVTDFKWLNEWIEALNYLPSAGQVGGRFFDCRYNKLDNIYPINVYKKLPSKTGELDYAWEVVGITGIGLYKPIVWEKLGKFCDDPNIAVFAGLESSERIKIAGLKNYLIHPNNYIWKHIELQNEFSEYRLLYKWDNYVRLVEEYYSGKKAINLKL